MRNWELAWTDDREAVLESAYEDMAREAYRLGYEAGKLDGYTEAEEDYRAEC